ncbi:unnamed protein product [Darwinula stevensoni]|uniref:C2H2-type domain-containing protein n=1 Tax=Darwinula stevensoni TaxID=69355 RepID=A0A7R9FST6_9CRUS|nr:unnamed protein product [Darwinula stevensoni]CAG0904206.1 unnamed protein product [Darwinula stevensoni]
MAEGNEERVYRGSSPASKKTCRRVSRDRDRDFYCRFCQRRFGKAYNLMIHERSHKESSPGSSAAYHCDVCDKSFKRHDTLKEHNFIYRAFHQSMSNDRDSSP